jgi:hypothetical protein
VFGEFFGFGLVLLWLRCGLVVFVVCGVVVFGGLVWVFGVGGLFCF